MTFKPLDRLPARPDARRSGFARAGFAGAMAVTVPAAIAAAMLAPAIEPAGAQQSQGKALPKPSAKQAAAVPDRPETKELAKFGAWGAYSAQREKSKLCYAMAQPQSREPKNLNRDPAYIFVSSEPSGGIRNELSIIMGFPTKEGAEARAVVGQTTFALLTSASHAWLKNPAEERQALAALQKGDKLIVKAESRRGSKLTDEYSLKGLAQALDRVSRECP